MFINMSLFAGEVVYPAKFDTIFGQVGDNRTELYLDKLGKDIEGSDMVMGKAKKTVIEYDNERIVIDEVRSWVNIENLNQLKLYRFRVYTEDQFENKSVPQIIALIPYTDAERSMLEVPIPRISYNIEGAMIRWPVGISSVMFDFHELEYRYPNKSGGFETGTVTDPRIGIPVQNVNPGSEFEIEVRHTVTPIRNETTRILDRVPIDRPIFFRMATSFAVTFETTGNGVLTARQNVNNFNSGDFADVGSTISFTATPNTGYKVKQWTNNDETVNGVASSYNLVVSGTHHITVEFEEND